MIGRVIRDYKIIEDLGGGMAEVYLAQRADGMLKRSVVMKIVRAHPQEKDRMRFIGEMQAQESLNHPNIAQIFDAGQLEDGRLFMIIEYVEGQSLRDMLIDSTAGDTNSIALPLGLVAEIAGQACAGLSEAHRKKIVHRDIKPENIIVSRDGSQYRVKIIDFGIALPQEKGILPTRIPTAGIIGTPEYLAPEQVMPEKYFLTEPGEKPGYSADIYALGVVVYEMLTGMRPFSGNGHQVALKHTWEIPIAPSKIRPELNIPEAVDRVVLKALAKQPAERQKSIELLGRELKEAIEASRKMTLITTKTEVFKTEQTQRPKILIPIESPIGRKTLSTKSLGILLGALLVGLAAFLLYFKSWKHNSKQVIGATYGGPAPSPTTPIAISKMKVSLIRRDRRGNDEPVSPETTFYNGDGVKLRIQADRDGFLYILSQGSSGRVSMLYPDRRIQGGKYRIVKGEVISIPTAGGWITFNETPGVEMVYMIFAENKSERFISEFGNATSQDKITMPADLERQAVDLVTVSGDLEGQGALLGVLKLNHRP
jgi:serine/threonine protein kinase